MHMGAQPHLSQTSKTKFNAFITAPTRNLEGKQKAGLYLHGEAMNAMPDNHIRVNRLQLGLMKS